MQPTNRVQPGDRAPRKAVWQSAVALAAAVFVLVASRASAAQELLPTGNTCISCHSMQLDQRLATPATLFGGQDVHREKGFECVDCHGGSPTSSDKASAHDASGRIAAMAFRGK